MSLPIGIKKARKNTGLSQQQVADRLHVHKQTVSDWERGKSSPGPKNIPTLARALGVTVGELYGEGDEERQEAEVIWINFPDDLKALSEKYLAREEFLEWMRLYDIYRQLPPGFQRQIVDLIAEGYKLISKSQDVDQT